MLDTFLFAFRAIAPILLFMATGFAFQHFGKWKQDFYRQLNSLCFNLFLPVQLFFNIYSIEKLTDINWSVIGLILVFILLLVLIGVLAAKKWIDDPAQRGVLVQATFRSNHAIIGLPLAASLGGTHAAAFTSMVTSFSVPLYNILAIVLLEFYSTKAHRRPTIKQLIAKITKNHLILGVAAGIVTVLIRSVIPTVDGEPVFSLQNNLPVLYKALESFSKVASPVMLFCLGARLNWKAADKMARQISLGLLFRLVVSPALLISLAVLLRTPLHLTATEIPALISCSASPVAVSSVVMVQEIGGDEQYASQLVVWSSVLSMFTIFLIVVILRSGGLL